MLSDERVSTGSFANSRADSYQDRLTSRGYKPAQSIDEEGETYNEYETKEDVDEQKTIDRPPQRMEEQYMSALQHRFRNRPKSDYSFTRPSGPAGTRSASSTIGGPTTSTQSTAVQTVEGAPSSNGAYQSAIRPNTGVTTSVGTSDDKSFSLPQLRRVTPEQQNTYARRVANQTETATVGTSTLDAKSKASTGAHVRINEQDIQTNRSTPSTFAHQATGIQPHESIFEKVHAPGGQVSYLGIGTFSQFEQCLRECLERERRQLGAASQVTRHVIPAGVSAYDYSFDSIVASAPSHLLSVHNSPHVIDYPSRSAATFLLEDIRHINVALSRSGIPIFPYQDSYPDSYSGSCYSTTVANSYPAGRHVTGEIVSACRVVEEDPAIIHNRDRAQAVKNVWNALQKNHPF